MFHRLTRADSIALLLIGFVALAFVWPVFLPGWIIPQGGGDLVSFLWPTYRYAAGTLHHILLGRAPISALLWNPTLYSGAPFTADNQTGLFYPPNLLIFLLFPDPPYAALEFLVALHLFIAGAGTYLFMRHELGNLDAWHMSFGLFPALAFMASDVFITHLGNYNIVAVSAWLPLIFLCLRKSLVSNLHEPRPDRRPRSFVSRIRWSLLTGLVFGLAALAGHAQMTFIVAVACALYGLCELVVQRDYRLVLLGFLSGLSAFGVAAVGLLPALEMLQHTARAGLDYAEASRWSLPPLGLAGMISPLVFGRGARDFWPPWDRVEMGYMGLAALTLALFARGKATRFYWLLALAGLLIAFGKNTPVHYLLYRVVPGFSSLRVPARFILLPNFGLAVLAGYALATLASRPPSFWRRETMARVGGLGLLPLLALLAPVPLGRAPAWTAALAALVLLLVTLFLLYRSPGWLPLLLFAELFVFGALVEVDRSDPNAGYTRGPAVDYLLSQPGPTRIDVATSRWQPDAPAVFGLESINGISNPLALAHYDRYYWSVGYRGSRQYNFLNAQFVVADKDSPPADDTFVPVFNEDPEVDIYLNTNAMPRVHLIYDSIFVDSPEAAFTAIHAPTFDPGSQVVLESPSTGYQLSAPDPQSPAPGLFYTAYGPGHFTLVAQTSSPAYLVIAEVWYPGWAGTVDGQSVPVLRANTAFMAVRVPSGESTIAFRFTSPLLAVGAVISATALAASLIALFWPGRPR